MEKLIAPLSAEKPCGENLEDTQALSAFDAYHVFGQLIVYRDEPDWRGLRALALSTLEQSKDLRVLAHLLAATLRTQPLSDALQLLAVISTWLERFWQDIYPRPEDDAIMCANVLTAFADRVAIVDPVKRLPLVRHVQLGSFCIRDYESIAEGRSAEDVAESSLTKEQIQAIVRAADAQEIASLHDLAAAASKALRDTEQIMRERAGAKAVPVLDPLANAVGRIEQILGPHVVRVRLALSESVGAAAVDSGAPEASRQPEHGSRRQALEALDIAAHYFSTQEPTSPVSPMLRRARRIAGMSFLEMLTEIAPEAVDHAVRITGRESTSQ